MGREIPILMSGPLVRATLEGAKPEYARYSRLVRVTSYGGQAWDKSGKVIAYDYEVTAGAETPNQRKGRPVKETCFRGDYELVSAPTEAQKEQQ